MNITDLIVEMLREGKRVELPGIGTFDSEVQAPRHDPETHIYYPATRNITFGTDFTNDSAIVNTIAERDCVSVEVAEQMWRNYVDALTDKIGRTGNHRFGELGSLFKEGGNYRFQMSEGVVIEAGSAGETPLEEVKTYVHDAADDPFAQFEVEPVTATMATPVSQPAEPAVEAVKKDEPVPEETPEPVPVIEENEPEAQVEVVSGPEQPVEVIPNKIQDEWQDTLKKLDELPKSKAMLKAEAKAEKERLRAEAKAEKERKRMEKKAKKEAAEEERMLAERRAAEEKRKAEARKKEEEAMRKAEASAEQARKKAEKKERALMERVEGKSDEERMKAEKRAAMLAAVAATQGTSDKAAANQSVSSTGVDVSRAQQEAAAEHERQLAQERLERLAAEKEAARRLQEEEQQRTAEKEAARRQKEEEESRKAAEKAAAKEEKRIRKEEERLRKEEERRHKEEMAAQAEALSRVEGGEEEKKKSHKWLWWLLLLLLLLLLGGAGWWFMNHRSATEKSAAVNTSQKHLDVAKSNDLTYNFDLLTYSSQEIKDNAELVRAEMKNYIGNFLAARNYKGAQVSVWNHVMQYVNQRMNELMGDRFAVQRVIPYDDNLYKLQEPWMRYNYAWIVRQTVQGELMEDGFLDALLDRLVDELSLNQGEKQHTAVEVQQVKQQERAQIEKAQQQTQAKKKKDEGSVPSFVYVSKESKNGFDIVAGFYLNKSTAGQMAARLHAEGCDAYIIEKNDGYYVSMGSTSTRTAAEAMFNHIKSWYDGDIAIKQW